MICSPRSHFQWSTPRPRGSAFLFPDMPLGVLTAV
uniref:Uncharacterized protein n=1 Tax=Peronospora matthiolae TaxID=2874970 RepID=A0AAV1TBN7_9STRA